MEAAAHSLLVSAVIALGLAAFLNAASAYSEPYRDIGDMFGGPPIGALGGKDEQWIVQRGYALKNPKAVTVFSLKLRAANSICEAGLDVLFLRIRMCTPSGRSSMSTVTGA
jgi:hypothetical protein